MKKKKMIVVVIFIVLASLFVVSFNRSVSIYEVIPESRDYIVNSIIVFDSNENKFELSADEKEQLMFILENAKYRKKIIPNIEKFDRDASIFINFESETISIRCDFDNRLIAVPISNGKIEQFYLDETSQLFSFLSKLQ